MATRLKSVAAQADPLDGMSLPGWLYHDPEFFEAEKRAFLLEREELGIAVGPGRQGPTVERGKVRQTSALEESCCTVV